MYESLLIVTLLLNIGADFLDRAAAHRADPYSLALWTTIVQFLLILPLIGLVREIDLAHLGLCAAVGAFTAFGRVPWYRALAQRSETLSRLAPFSRLSSVMVLIVAYTALGETFTVPKAAGGALMIGGALLVGFERPAENLRAFFRKNAALGLVMIFAASIASIAIFYKVMLNDGIPILTTYFYLKLFQMAALVLVALQSNTLMRSYDGIAHLRLFVLGRTLQTVAAVIYLIVLLHLDLSTVEPIAALGPILLFAIEWAIARRRAAVATAGGGTLAVPAMTRRVTALRLVALGVVVAGLLLLQAG